MDLLIIPTGSLVSISTWSAVSYSEDVAGLTAAWKWNFSPGILSWYFSSVAYVRLQVEMTTALCGCNETPIILYVFIHTNPPCFSFWFGGPGREAQAILLPFSAINPRIMWSPGTLRVSVSVSDTLMTCLNVFIEAQPLNSCVLISTGIKRQSRKAVDRDRLRKED